MEAAVHARRARLTVPTKFRDKVVTWQVADLLDIPSVVWDFPSKFTVTDVIVTWQNGTLWNYRRSYGIGRQMLFLHLFLSNSLLARDSIP
jgi:hypothetical protein